MTPSAEPGIEEGDQSTGEMLRELKQNIRSGEEQALHQEALQAGRSVGAEPVVSLTTQMPSGAPPEFHCHQAKLAGEGAAPLLSFQPKFTHATFPFMSIM